MVATLALVFALTGFFAMSLEFHRHRFAFTLAEAVLAVGFFVAGPIGLAVAAALGECVNMVVQRHSPLKVAFNVSNRLAATTAAGVAFAALGNTNVHDAAAWGAALGAALCFSILDVVSTSAVISIVEETRFPQRVRPLRDRRDCSRPSRPRRSDSSPSSSPSTGRSFRCCSLPIAVAVALNAGYAVAQRDEHLRFERLYESSARTASLVALDDALRSLAAETRSLGTGVARAVLRHRTPTANGAARTPTTTANGAATSAEVVDAVALAGTRRRPRDRRVARGRDRRAWRRRRGVRSSCRRNTRTTVASCCSSCATGPANSGSGAKSRVETLAAFAHNAALIVSNALLHEEREVALARQVDLNRQKSDFVAAVSHELRTPLAVMLGSVHTLDRLDGRMTERTAIRSSST